MFQAAIHLVARAILSLALLASGALGAAEAGSSTRRYPPLFHLPFITVSHRKPRHRASPRQPPRPTHLRSEPWICDTGGGQSITGRDSA